MRECLSDIYGCGVADEAASDQVREVWTSPTRAIRARIKEVRTKRGWTVDDLAARCAQVGMEKLNRSVIANFESGRRQYVTVDEAAVLAYVLDVAPVHLHVPIEVDEAVDAHRYQPAPDRFLTIGQAREWFRGRYCPPGRDPRVYWSEVPRAEWDPPRPSDDDISDAGARFDLVETVTPPGRRDEQGDSDVR